MKWSSAGLAVIVLAASVGLLAKSPEDRAWEQVDSLYPQSVVEFLKQFPHGKHASEAQLTLSLLEKFAAIKEKKIEPACRVPSEALGQEWRSWQEGNRVTGVIGYCTDMFQTCRPSPTGGLFLKNGSIGFDSSKIKPIGCNTLGWFPPFTGGKTTGLFNVAIRDGAMASPTADGSIVAFRTGGVKYQFCGPNVRRYEFIGDVFIRTPPGETAFFGVLEGALVYLAGPVKVSLPGGQTFDLK